MWAMAHTLFGSFTLSGAGCINGPIKGTHALKLLFKISNCNINTVALNHG